jgi:uncharacterized protein (TIGR01777 family)
VKWLLAGSSGFLGTALRKRLATRRDEVVRLVRRDPASSRERRWDPATGILDPAAFDGVDVVINLAGVGVAGWLWTDSRREAIRSSRVDTTATLAKALGRLESPPAFIHASGVAFYGTERDERPSTEDSPPTTDFLAQVVVAWEEAARPAVAAGGRVVSLRTSPVMSASGSTFKLMRLAWSLGAGAKLGDGSQRMPMIALEDYLRALIWAAETPDAAGPYNLTIPEPTTNLEFSDVLAEALHRPRFVAAPAPVLRAVLGELAEQLLGDMYVLPARLTAAGFTFTAPDVRTLVASALRG